MPPEPFPWDRKDDCIRERKHERTESFGSAPRWRNSPTTSYSSHYGSRDFDRWESLDFRRPSGHGKQGGCHPFDQTSSLGCGPSRSCDRMFGDETYRPYASHGDLRYWRSSRENRGSFGQRDWKSHSWETNNGSASASGRPHDMNIDQRSVDNLAKRPNSHSDSANRRDQIQSKDQSPNTATGNNGLIADHRCEGEASLGSVDLKSLSWTRSISLSSRGSGLSHSSSSKSIGAVDSGEQMDEHLPKNSTMILPPSGNAAPSVTSAVSPEGTSRKKSRLGWGEGLAKYEKKRVEHHDVKSNKDGPIALANISDYMLSPVSNLVDKSPGDMVSSYCVSPATPSSVACSSSPEDNSFGKTAQADNAIGNMCTSPDLGSQNHLAGTCFNLEKLDDTLLSNLGSSLNEILQFADQSSMDSSFVGSTAMNKLLVWKGTILKDLEMTDSKIDLLENELKVLKSESGSLSLFPAASSSLAVEDDANKEPEAVSALIPQPTTPSQTDSCVDEMVRKTPQTGVVLGKVNVDANSEDLDSPGTATSKLLEPISLAAKTSPSKVEGPLEVSGDMLGMGSVDSVPSSTEIHVSASVDVNKHAKGQNLAPVSADINLDDTDNISCSAILASNKESAREASDLFNKLLPGDCGYTDISGVSSGSWDCPLIIQRFSARKRSLQFKERVLSIKFKAFRNLWKDDMYRLSMRKRRAKSQKKVELGLHTANGGCQKLSTPLRSQFSLPEGDLRLVPAAEIVKLTGKLLSDSQPKPCRNFLKMPALILEEKEKMSSRFISSNGLVEDPSFVEKEKAMINPWTSEEKEIFMDKFSTYGKNFRKIASFLDHRTTADCVEFYYKYHKSDCFKKMKKLDSGKQEKSIANTYLVASSKKWNRGNNAASPDILGEVSVMAAHSDNALFSRSTFSGKILLGKHSESKLSRRDDIIDRSCSFDLPGKQTSAADILAGIRGSVSSEAMSSCVTTCVDLGEGYKDRKTQRVDAARRKMSDITQTVGDDTCSNDSCGELDPGDWTNEERSALIQAFLSYGKDFARISRCVRTRSQDQCRVFFSKARKRLRLDSIDISKAEAASVSDDANDDGSDMEDASVLETSSVVCNGKMDAKMDEDLQGSHLNKNHDAPYLLDQVKLETDLNSSEEHNEIGILDQKELVKSDTSETRYKPKALFEDGTEAVNSKSLESRTQSVQQTDNGLVVSADDTEGKRGPEIVQAISSSLVSFVAPSLHSDFQLTCKEGSEQQKPSLPETNLKENVFQQRDVHAFEQYSQMRDGNMSNNRVVDASSSKFQNFGCMPQVPFELRSPITPLPQENSAAFQTEEKPKKEMLSTLDLWQGNEFVGRVAHNQHFESVNHVDSSQILSGYPLRKPVKKEMDEELAEAQTKLKSDVGITNTRLSQGAYFLKHNGSIPNGSTTAQAFSSKERKLGPSRAHSCGLSETEKPSKTGDVKLFGKILATHESEGKGNNHDKKQIGRPSTLSFAGHNVDGRQTIMQLNHNNQFGLENVPVRSYGFWDGTKILSGFPSLPDSARLLSKYPDAFAGYRAQSSSKMEQQQVLQSINKSSDDHRNLNGVSLYPPAQLYPCNGVMDSLMYRKNPDDTRTRPLTLGRDLIFSEMHRRNGFEAMPNLMQRPWTAVSDPVAAIKMHYAKTEKYNEQNGRAIGEDKPWKAKGETGR